MEKHVAKVPTITLPNHETIPQLGFGVYQVDPEETARIVKYALDTGYRHIDTAEMYGNEAGVGEAVKQSGLNRSDVFITSKLNNGYHKPDDVKAAFEESLSKLATDYLDLFIIHWPLPTRYNGDYVSTWKALIEIQKSGKAKSVGVSNFEVTHLERIMSETDTAPAVNQIELHPYFQNRTVADYCRKNNIPVEAWSPIAQGGVLKDETIIDIAGDVGKTPAQVVLRWHIQHGYIIFPKSANPKRIKENFTIFDFELTSQHMERIDALDKGEAGRTGPNPNTFDMIPG
jgi:2,5-diketo-D-gluconate reductase A